MQEKIEVETALIKDACEYPPIARALIVTNDRELAIADGYLKGNKALQKKIREWFKPHKTKAREALNGLIADEKALLDPLGEAEGIVKGKMTPYLEEKARIRREAEEAARRAKAEAEAALRRAKAEAEAKALAIEEEKQRKAREALHDGELEKAEKILEEKKTEVVPVKEEDFIPEEIVVPEKVDLKGTYIRTTWEYEVVDIDLVPRSLLILDRVRTNKIVQHQKDKTNIPGIRVFQKTDTRSRGG